MTIRSDTLRMGVVAALAAALAAVLAVLLFPGKATTAALQSPAPIVPLAANWDFDGESSTNLTEPGIVLYDRNIITPAAANVLFITFSGTGDQHDSSQTLMHCSVDGVACSADEFVVLQYYEDFDFHDNNINYTWCARIPPGQTHRNVKLRLASSEGGDVYVEQMHFYVNATFMPHGCEEIATGSPDALGGHGG
jgi:hypothetical protein